VFVDPRMVFGVVVDLNSMFVFGIDSHQLIK
jgi:hypothetical protein